MNAMNFESLVASRGADAHERTEGNLGWAGMAGSTSSAGILEQGMRAGGLLVLRAAKVLDSAPAVPD